MCALVTGAHTLGRVKKDRSGFGKEKTKYTENGPGTPGGTSWTIEWLKFDNSYFKACLVSTKLLSIVSTTLLSIESTT